MRKDIKGVKKYLRGTIVSLPVPQSVEIIAAAGFDWILIDMEHSGLALSDVHSLLNAAAGRLITIVRVPGNDEIWIKRVLDLGCDGILVPMVNSGEDARAAVTAALYPPAGRRSVGVSRAHGYGPGFAGYIARANSDVIIMLQVEHADAVAAFDEIAGVRGLGAVFIGPYDLSASMGLAGQVTHERVAGAIELVRNKCNKAEIPWGIFSMNPAGLKEHIDAGCTFALCSTDAFMLATAARGVADSM